MKLFQIKDGMVYYEMTDLYVDLADARRHYSPKIQIEEAPDRVFPGWSFDASKQGDDRFIQPTTAEGQAYNPDTGEIWIPEEVRLRERTRLHEATTNDTLQALRKIRENDQSIDWQSWLNQLDAYNIAIEKTQEQEGYPLKVTYPEYPVKPTKTA